MDAMVCSDNLNRCAIGQTNETDALSIPRYYQRNAPQYIASRYTCKRRTSLLVSNQALKIKVRVQRHLLLRIRIKARLPAKNLARGVRLYARSLAHKVCKPGTHGT